MAALEHLILNTLRFFSTLVTTIRKLHGYYTMLDQPECRWPASSIEHGPENSPSKTRLRIYRCGFELCIIVSDRWRLAQAEPPVNTAVYPGYWPDCKMSVDTVTLVSGRNAK